MLDLHEQGLSALSAQELDEIGAGCGCEDVAHAIGWFLGATYSAFRDAWAAGPFEYDWQNK